VSPRGLWSRVIEKCDESGLTSRCFHKAEWVGRQRACGGDRAFLLREHMEYLRDKYRGFLATVGKGLKPRIVPVCFAYKEDRIYVPVDRKPKRTVFLARLRDIEDNPNVSFIADTYSEDWSILSYILVFGKAYVLKEGEEFVSASNMLLNRYPQYHKIGADFAFIICIEPVRVKLWRFTEAK
jgi:PPOX class probable F420-dependent enzyme